MMSLFGAKIGGTNHGLWEVIDALKIVDKWYALDHDMVRNAPRCQECKLSGPYVGGDALWHTVLVRETVAQDIAKNKTFKWTKKKGIGRKPAADYLAELVAAKEETWFTLEIYEI
jgi:hypothetical protein